MAVRFGVEDFHVFIGWLYEFKIRLDKFAGIGNKSVCGVSKPKSIDVNTVCECKEHV